MLVALVKFFPLVIILLTNGIYLLVELSVHFFKALLSAMLNFSVLLFLDCFICNLLLFNHQLLLGCFSCFSVLRFLVAWISIYVLGFVIGLVGLLSLWWAGGVGSFVRSVECRWGSIDGLVLSFILVIDIVFVVSFVGSKLSWFVCADVIVWFFWFSGIF